MPILARFTDFLDFYGFWKPAATKFLGISKIQRVNFEIHSFSCYLFLKTLFSGEVLKI